MGCGCKGSQAAARTELDNGSVAGTAKVMAEVLNPYVVLAPAKSGGKTVKQDTTEYSTGVFVQTGKKKP